MKKYFVFLFLLCVFLFIFFFGFSLNSKAFIYSSVNKEFVSTLYNIKTPEINLHLPAVFFYKLFYNLTYSVDFFDFTLFFHLFIFSYIFIVINFIIKNYNSEISFFHPLIILLNFVFLTSSAIIQNLSFIQPYSLSVLIFLISIFFLFDFIKNKKNFSLYLSIFFSGLMIFFDFHFIIINFIFIFIILLFSIHKRYFQMLLIFFIFFLAGAFIGFLSSTVIINSHYTFYLGKSSVFSYIDFTGLKFPSLYKFSEISNQFQWYFLKKFNILILFAFLGIYGFISDKKIKLNKYCYFLTILFTLFVFIFLYIEFIFLYPNMQFYHLEILLSIFLVLLSYPFFTNLIIFKKGLIFKNFTYLCIAVYCLCFLTYYYIKYDNSNRLDDFYYHYNLTRIIDDKSIYITDNIDEFYFLKIMERIYPEPKKKIYYFYNNKENLFYIENFQNKIIADLGLVNRYFLTDFIYFNLNRINFYLSDYFLEHNNNMLAFEKMPLTLKAKKFQIGMPIIKLSEKYDKLKKDIFIFISEKKPKEINFIYKKYNNLN